MSEPTILPGAEPFAFDGGPTGVLMMHGFTGSRIHAAGRRVARGVLALACSLER